MTKEEWLELVRKRLIGLSPESREKVLDHYEELFSIAKANGKGEEEIIEMLNDLNPPNDIQQHQQPFIQRVLLGSSYVLINSLFIVGPIVVIVIILVTLIRK